MFMSRIFQLKRKNHIECLSEKMVNRQIKAKVDEKECDLTIMKIIDKDVLHHLSSELDAECKTTNDKKITIKLWLFIFSGKYKLFQPFEGGSFEILSGDALKELVE